MMKSKIGIHTEHASQKLKRKKKRDIKKEEEDEREKKNMQYVWK